MYGAAIHDGSSVGRGAEEARARMGEQLSYLALGAIVNGREGAFAPVKAGLVRRVACPCMDSVGRDGTDLTDRPVRAK
jgi:hypothetical protein